MHANFATGRIPLLAHSGEHQTANLPGVFEVPEVIDRLRLLIRSIAATFAAV
jgi:hypothetical protein